MNEANLNRQICKKQQKKWISQRNKSVAFVTVALTKHKIFYQMDIFTQKFAKYSRHFNFVRTVWLSIYLDHITWNFQRYFSFGFRYKIGLSSSCFKINIGASFFSFNGFNGFQTVAWLIC